MEVDLTGHAALASALVLMTELDRTRTEVVFRCNGALPVRRDGQLFVLDFPRQSLQPAGDAAAVDTITAALGAAGRLLRSMSGWR